LKILQKRDFGGGEWNKMGKLLDEWEIHSQRRSRCPASGSTERISIS
jgi:hypothetical protein